MDVYFSADVETVRTKHTHHALDDATEQAEIFAEIFEKHKTT